MKCICGNKYHNAVGVSPRETRSNGRILDRRATLRWCTTPSCEQYNVIQNICRNCGAWVPTQNGISKKCECQTVKVINDKA